MCGSGCSTAHPALMGELVFRRDRSNHHDFLRMIVDPDPAADSCGSGRGPGGLH